MSGLDNLNTRLRFAGGKRQQDRMNEDKLKSLRKALIYSYQGATAILQDKREFRCLINPNKMSNDLDDKIISIPFEDVCLNQEKMGTTTEGIQSIGMKPGDVFEWKENGTHWLVTLQYKNETAYFRAQIRQAKQEVRIGDRSYWCYVRGPAEQIIIWSQVANDYFNKLNYSLVLYVTKDENTERELHRFTKLEIGGKPWEVQAIDNLSVDGIIEVALKETFQNSIEEMHENQPEAPILEEEIIIGDKIVRPYDIKDYAINENYIVEDGHWELSCGDAGTGSKNAVARLMQNGPAAARVEILTGRMGSFILSYVTSENTFSVPIEIKSL